MPRIARKMSRRQKRMLLLALDSGAVVPALWLVGGPGPLTLPLIAAAILLAAGLGTHRLKLSTFDPRAALPVAALSAGLGAATALMALGTPVPAAGVAALHFLIVTGVRLAGRRLLGGGAAGRVPVVIYGAGSAGRQLAAALAASRRARPVAFVDDDPSLQGAVIGGLRVEPPAALAGMVRKGRARRICLAMPSVARERQRRILGAIGALGCELRALPAYPDLAAESGLAEGLHPVSADDLLGRDSVDLGRADIVRAFAGQSVMVTGAGGSIGSELCREILACNPGRLVLYEQSELALYQIERELAPLAHHRGIELVARLGCITSARAAGDAIAENGVGILLHAAAYKHVPMVERNPLEGARINVLGTLTLAEAAVARGVGRFILISTDKAVRPTNMMGATKRLAEMAVQDLQARSPGTRFAIVRFGNVLGSSGSVIPLFREQIAAGGPVTVTHPEVTRFFMTLREAARLVLLAGTYAEGGEVCVLDMGRPVRILELARRMIRLSGLSIRDAENPQGDIEIRTIGLRPGEKLFEELLIGADMLPTPHPKILRAQEGCPGRLEMASTLREIRLAVERGDAEALRRIAETRVAGYRPDRRSVPALPPLARAGGSG